MLGGDKGHRVQLDVLGLAVLYRSHTLLSPVVPIAAPEERVHHIRVMALLTPSDEMGGARRNSAFPDFAGFALPAQRASTGSCMYGSLSGLDDDDMACMECRWYQ